MDQYCTVRESEEFQILTEIAHMLRGHSPRDQQKILEKTKEFAAKRWEETREQIEQYKELLRNHEEDLFSDALDKGMEGNDSQEIAQMIFGDERRQELKGRIVTLELEPKYVTSEDNENFMKNYEKKGYVKVEDGRLKLTSKGVRFLGRVLLTKIMQNMKKRGVGTHVVGEIGFGSAFSTFTRSHELGDTYDRIDFEKTFLNVLERGKETNEFGIEDLEVVETLHQTKLNVGIIVDESGSMSYRRRSRSKIDSAIETALALAELMRTKYPQDKLRVFTFSEEVKEIQPWDLPSIQVPMQYTNIRAGLRSYRLATAHKHGNKQVYLITDTDPNFENGKYVGFHKAAQGVLEEATRYREENITLNIVMLDQTSHLKKFASMLAKQNLGRVVFTTPENLGEAILEDYLASKRERL